MFHFFFSSTLSLISFDFQPTKEPLIGALFPILWDTKKDMSMEQINNTKQRAKNLC